MNAIYAVRSSADSGKFVLDQVWTQGGEAKIDGGYTSLAPVRVGRSMVLFAYDKTAQKTDIFMLSNAAPWVQKKGSSADLASGPWDDLSAFVLGNNTYLMAYRRDSGTFGFYQLASDLSLSKPYIFSLTRDKPTKGFTTVAPFTSLDRQYFLGYNFDSGAVAAFSLEMKISSPSNVPPLHAENIWYNQWSNGWSRFAFFQLGEANFFFKINAPKQKINIDHIHDDPSRGVNSVGTKFDDQIPDAFSIDIVARVPWQDDEPHILAYTAAGGSAAIYRIHANCRSLTKVADSITQQNIKNVVPYRIGNDSYVLFYEG